MKAAITAIAYATGSNRVGLDEMRARFGTETADKIAAMSGILERRAVDANTCASDLAENAARLLFDSSLASPESIDLLIFATQTPDYAMPSNACIMQDRLGLGKSCAAFDINLGCSQFPYALATAGAWLEASLARRALVITADTATRLIHPMDKSAVSLFGDAAAATIVEKSDDSIDFVFGTNGAGYADLICPTSGMRTPPTPRDFEEYTDADGNVRTNANMKIDGFKIFAFAYKTIPQAVNELLKKNGMGVDDIDLFVFHQAGEMMVSAAADRLKIPPEKVYFKMHDIGNCGGASVPIALADAAINGRLKAGMKVAVCAFGVGLSWGAALLEWSGKFAGAKTSDDYSDSPEKPASQRRADAK